MLLFCNSLRALCSVRREMDHVDFRRRLVLAEIVNSYKLPHLLQIPEIDTTLLKYNVGLVILRPG